MSGNPHGATTIRASKSGGGGKWLIMALAAAVLVGVGYWAWAQFGANPAHTETAFNEYAEEPLRAGPLDTQSDELAESGAPEDAATAPATARPRPATSAEQVTAAELVPEETIGITPINATSEDAAIDQSEEVIVRAPPRPVWSRTPTARRLTSLYPVNALERGREGEARLHCTIAAGGTLDCERVEETRSEFGVAALRVARSYRHATTRADGSDAVGTPVNLRVVFRLEDEGRGQRFAAR